MPMIGRTARGEAQRYFREVVLAYSGDECLTWPYSKDADGYGKMRQKGCSQLVHRHVCEEINGPPPTPRHEAAHSCGKGKDGCVAKRHLSWKTPAGNRADKVTHGTHNRGERHVLAKLTETDVREIRSLKGALTQSEIAGRFGINQTHVGLIHRKKTWAWLSEAEAA